MAGAPPEADTMPEESPAEPVRRRWHRRLAKWTVGLLLGLFLLAGLGLILLDTAPGHRFLADRIAGQAPARRLALAA